MRYCFTALIDPKLQDESPRSHRLSRRARNVSKGIYAVEEGEGSDFAETEASPDRPRRQKKKVPPLRIRVLGRGGEGSGSSSPMFLAETVGEVCKQCISHNLLIISCVFDICLGYQRHPYIVFTWTYVTQVEYAHLHNYASSYYCKCKR